MSMPHTVAASIPGRRGRSDGATRSDDLARRMAIPESPGLRVMHDELTSHRRNVTARTPAVTAPAPMLSTGSTHAAGRVSNTLARVSEAHRV